MSYLSYFTLLSLPYLTLSYPNIPCPTMPTLQCIPDSKILYPTSPYPTLTSPSISYPSIIYLTCPTLPYPILGYPTKPYLTQPCLAIPPHWYCGRVDSEQIESSGGHDLWIDIVVDRWTKVSYSTALFERSLMASLRSPQRIYGFVYLPLEITSL